jgi:hypothetical protein
VLAVLPVITGAPLALAFPSYDPQRVPRRVLHERLLPLPAR